MLNGLESRFENKLREKSTATQPQPAAAAGYPPPTRLDPKKRLKNAEKNLNQPFFTSA